MVRALANVIVVTVIFCAAASSAFAQPGDPPLEVYIHTKSEDGNQELVVRYHANGTFELSGEDSSNTRGQSGLPARFSTTGRWWRTSGEPGADFCWHTNPNRGGKTYEPHCKPAGRLIGRARVDK